MFYYKVYFRRTNELVASGTSKECAKQLKITLAGFRTIAENSKKGKCRNYKILQEPYFEAEAIKEDKK